MTIGYVISQVQAICLAFAYCSTFPMPRAIRLSRSWIGSMTFAEYSSRAAPVAAVTRNGHGDWVAFPVRTWLASASAALTAASRYAVVPSKRYSCSHP